MDTPQPNPHEARISAHLSQLGLPVAARDWLLHALHPAGTYRPVGVPDESLTPAVHADYRTSHTVSAPVGLAAGATWDLCIVQLPGDANAVWYAGAASPADFTTRIAPTPNVSGIINVQPAQWMTPPTAYCVQSNTTRQYAVQQLSSCPWRARHRALAFTAYMVASALNDQGTVTAATVPSRYSATSWGDMNSGSLVGGNIARPAIAVNCTFNLPLEEVSMQLLTPRPVVLPAREGIYLPARYLGPGVPYCLPTFADGRVGTSIADLQNLIPDGSAQNYVGTAQLPVFPVLQGLSSPLGYYQPSWLPITALLAASGGAGSVCAPLDSCFTGMTSGVAIFRGLSASASITIKTFVGLEVAVRSDSPHRQFTVPANPYSALALSSYHDIAASLPDGYPASFNSWGTILASIARVATRVVPILGPALWNTGRSIVGAFRGQPSAAAPSLSEQQVVRVQEPSRARTPSVPRMAVTVRKKGTKKKAGVRSSSKTSLRSRR